MRLSWALFLALVAALAPISGLAEPTPTVSLNVTIAKALEMANHALETGNPDLAARIAAQILATDPKNAAARALLVAGQSRSGHAIEATANGRKSFTLAATKSERFEAAFLTAEAYSLANKPALAKWWLRRASNAATDEQAKTLIAPAFAQLNARTPVRLNFKLAIGPSNNVNGGSIHDSFMFAGIPLPISQALSGVVGSASAQLSYRLPQGENFAATLFITAKHREVALSDRARTLNSVAKGADYRVSSLDMGGAAQWAIDPATSLQFQAQIGRRWYKVGTGDTQSVGVGVAQKLANNHVARIDLTTEFTQFSQDSRLNARRVEATGTYALPLMGGSMSGSLSLIELSAAGAGVAYHAVSVGAELRPKPVVDGIDVEFSASAEARDYFKVPMSHPDILLNAGAAATFNKATVFGFAPVVSLSAVRSKSDVVVRDTFDLGLSIGFSSAF